MMRVRTKRVKEVRYFFFLGPTIEGAYRIEESNAGLPSIPAQPIGYDEAEVLLQ